MTRFNGKQTVNGGYYLNLKTWEIATVREDHGQLPGSAADQYAHLPVLALMVLAPVMGGLFAVALPFLGFAMPIQAAGKKLVQVSGKAMSELMATLAPSWQPGEAYLAGKPEQKKDEKAAPGEAPKAEGEIAKVEAEIQARREEKK